jgi:hypothetical protein
VAGKRSGDDEQVRDPDVGFFDVNAPNFLIAYVRVRPHINDMKSTTAKMEQGRKTKQGLRDLNYYGPRRATNAPAPATVADEESGREARPPAGAPAEGTLTK